SGTTKYIPVSPEMVKSNRRAALTTLAFYQALYPEQRLFRGKIFFLGGSTDLQNLTPDARRAPVLAGDLSAIATRELPSILRPYTFPPLEIALLRDWDQKMQRLAEASATLPITLVGGVPSWLLVLFEKLRQIAGKATLAEIWPALRLLVHGGT